MSPVSLHLEYFGPYRDETIDFTKFSATPLFLISGKTGSGKTTIFDGMCYALFNQTSGVDREAKAMRSDFATATDTTRVTFAFTHREHSYEIVREPTQILAKKRGTGMTESAASVTLTIFENDVEQDQITKEGNVGRYLQNLLQMDGKQFAQIVLLPQGQFRRFLVAPSEDKAAVLEQLFNTTIFARWTDLLKKQLKQNESANRETAATLARLRAGLKWTPENQVAAEALIADQRTAELLTLMATQQADTKTQQTAATKKLAQAEGVQSNLVRQDEQEGMLVADRQQLGQRQAELTEINDKAPAMSQLQDHIKELEWVQQIRPQWQAQSQTAQTVVHRQRAQEDTQKQLTTALADQQAAVKKQQDQQPLVAKIKQQTDHLAQQQALKPVYQQVADLQQRVTASQKNVARATQALTATQQAVSKNQANQQDQQKTVDQQSAIFETQNQLTQRAADLQVTAKQVTDLQQLDQQLAGNVTTAQAAEVEVNIAQQAATQQRTLADERYQAFLRSQIAALSAQLKPGSPCPVCGSEDHPHPAATSTATVVAEDEVKDVQALASKLEKKASNLAANLKSLQEHITGQQTARDDQLTVLRTALQQPTSCELSALAQVQAQAVAAYQTAHTENEQQLHALAAAQKALATLTAAATPLQEQAKTAESTLKTHQSALDKITTELATESKRLPTGATTLAAFTAQLDQLSQQLTEDQGTLDAANQAVQRAQNTVAVQQSQLKQANKELATSQADRQEAQTALDALLTAHFETVNEQVLSTVGTALSELPTLTQQRQQLTDFQQRRESVNVAIQELTKRTKGKDAPDREKTQVALATAKQQVAALQEALRQLRNFFEFNADQVKQLQMQVDKQAAALQTTQEITELSGVVNGDGPNSKLGLERYVLQTYLRQILSVGNNRLKQLTNGRYEFVIDESQANSKKRSGLEINVYDDHVGEQRSVHTLSGGESFIASLALALALGEVIQQTTGSVDVDALFIDEGFGSLDEDALMTALESLETIEGKHRMIGIISHVSELRDQVENQLQVIANGNGESTIRYHAAE
ncbi:AAA family ATPase [Levilactobacillus cerevisiae]|uniref:AAA family ATPase n=1 Tax=Levilactobacillus cerevisiae TaxID=1704076 RepID=UPI000F79F39C|nr:SMC family ATPase [Levilactobacillus cerevisiae]